MLGNGIPIITKSTEVTLGFISCSLSGLNLGVTFDALAVESGSSQLHVRGCDVQLCCVKRTKFIRKHNWRQTRDSEIWRRLRAWKFLICLKEENMT